MGTRVHVCLYVRGHVLTVSDYWQKLKNLSAKCGHVKNVGPNVSHIYTNNYKKKTNEFIS